jgi:hypothetical protein
VNWTFTCQFIQFIHPTIIEHVLFSLEMMTVNSHLFSRKGMPERQAKSSMTFHLMSGCDYSQGITPQITISNHFNFGWKVESWNIKNSNLGEETHGLKFWCSC